MADIKEDDIEDVFQFIKNGNNPTLPNFGLLHLLLEQNVHELLNMRIDYFKLDEDSYRLIIYNQLKDYFHASEDDISSVHYCLYSMFLKNKEDLGINNFIRIPTEIKEEVPITINCKKNPKDGKIYYCEEENPNCFKHSFVPKIGQFIFIDPLTEALVNGQSICFGGDPNIHYKISYLVIESNKKEFEENNTLEVVIRQVIKTAKDILLVKKENTSNEKK